MAKPPQRRNIPAAKRARKLETAIQYLHANIPASLVKEYRRIRSIVDLEHQRAGSLRRDLRSTVLQRLQNSPELPQGAFDTKVYRKAAGKAADSVIDHLKQNDLIFISLRAWQPYRDKQQKFLARLQRASPAFLDDFQLHMNAVLQAQRKTQKLIRRETLLDFIIDLKSRDETASLSDFKDRFKAVSKSLPPLEH